MPHWYHRRKPAIGVLASALVVATLVVAGWPAHAQEQPGSDFAAVDEYVREQMDGSRIPGVSIAIVEGDQLVHARGFGNDGHGDPVTPDTPFWIGSNTKSFTALAVMQLAEAGTVDLDAPVQQYVPEFTTADPEAASRITVRHLLNQTSGFSREDGIAMVAEAEDQSLEQAVAGFRDLELNRPVGETFEYSNPNFVVLGLLVQRLSGQSWQDYVEANIFGPLGMTNSYTTLRAAEANGLTATYRYWFGVPRETEGDYLDGLAPTGYLYSSASDLARYLTMYLQGGVLEGERVLSEQGIAEMLAPATNVREFELQGHEFRAQYGAGWFVGPFGAAEDARWHGGTLPHFIAWVVLLPETDQAVVVLVNASHQLAVAGANDVFVRIPIGVVDLLRGEDPPTGLGLTTFYVAFDAIVLAVLGVQVWSLYRVARRPRSLGRGARAVRELLPLTWEVGVSLVLLVALAPSWSVIFGSTPDVALVAAIVALLWLATGAARGLRLAQSRVAPSRRVSEA